MKILVTGGAGSIGSNLINKLSKNNNNQVFVVDNLWRGKIENLIIDNKPLINLKRISLN